MTDEEYAAERAAKERATQELQWRNRRVIAERLRWPAGVLEICERLDRLHPPWHVDWEDANLGPSRWAHSARYSATRYDVSIEDGDPMRTGDGIRRHPTVHGETVDQLRAAITAMDHRIAEMDDFERRTKVWMASRPRS